MSQRRHRNRKRSERSGTRPSLILSALVTLCGVGAALWVGGGHLSGILELQATGDIPALQRMLLGFAVLPWLLRVFLAQPPKDEAEAYKVFIRTALVGLALSALIAVFSQTLDLSQYRGGVTAEIKTGDVNTAAEEAKRLAEARVAAAAARTADSPTEISIIAAISIVMIGAGLPLMAEGMMSIVRYRANKVWRTMSWVYGALVVLAFIGGQLLPLPMGNLGEEFRVGFIPVIVAVVALAPAVLLAFRTGWMTNLRRPRKVAVTFAALAMFGSVFLMMGSLDESIFIPTEHVVGVVPGLLTSMLSLSVPLLVFSTIAFVAALFALPSAGAIDRRNDEMGWLARFSGLLMRSLDEGSFIETALASARESTGATAAWFIMARDGGAAELVTGASTGVPRILVEKVMEARDDEGHPLKQSALHTLEPLLVADPAPGVGSVAVLPLLHAEEHIGALVAAHRDRHGFDRESLLILRALADQVALVREHAELVRRSIEQEKLEGEMEVARDMQARLLPRVMPESPFYELSAMSEPARIVGGDYYDVVSFADKTLGLVIADVAGKGPGAALYMGMVKGIVQGLSGECDDPAELLRRANVALHGAIDGRWFVTMTCAQVIDHLHKVRVARAGHCPTLVVRSGKVEWIRSRGMGLAIARPDLFNPTLDLVELDFAPGDALVLVSDGLPEARSEEGEEFGDDRLAETVRMVMEDHEGAEGLRDAILSAVRTFTADAEQHDDSTLVVLRWRGGSTTPASAEADRTRASLLQPSTST